MKRLVYALIVAICANCTSYTPADQAIDKSQLPGYYVQLVSPKHEDPLSSRVEPVLRQVEILAEGNIIYHTNINGQGGGFASIQRWKLINDTLKVIHPRGSVTSWNVQLSPQGITLQNQDEVWNLKRIEK